MASPKYVLTFFSLISDGLGSVMLLLRLKTLFNIHEILNRICEED